MFIDEDGDVAHEFYEEFKVDNSHTTEMRRKLVNLRPEVLKIPTHLEVKLILTKIFFYLFFLL